VQDQVRFYDGVGVERWKNFCRSFVGSERMLSEMA
jgi:hypothetical protein